MLIGVHYPKAGGSSVGMALTETYGARLLRDYDEAPPRVDLPMAFDPIGYFARDFAIPAGIECVYGHLHINKYRRIPDARRFVMLRHPVDALMSTYFYFQSVPDNVGSILLQYIKKNKLTVLEMARIPTYTHLMSRTYFGGVDMSCFDLIGRHDQRDVFFASLSALAEQPINPDHEINVTPRYDERSEMLGDTQLISRLNDILRDDVRFYERHAYRD